MARRQMRGERYAAQPDCSAVADQAINADGRKFHATTWPVTYVAIFKKGLIGSTRDHRCAACPLQPREPARMIDMRVAVEQIFHIADIKA